MFKILGVQQPSVHVHRVVLPLAFIMQPVDSIEGVIMFSLNGLCLDTHLQAVDIDAFCLTKLEFPPPPPPPPPPIFVGMCDLKMDIVICQ